MILRDYQHLARDHTTRRIEDGQTRLYVHLPTGTGKGVILVALAAQEQEVGRVLVLVHRQEIALQLVETLQQAGVEAGVLMEGRRELTAPTVVATVQSLTSANVQALIEASETPIATILIDEAHHAVEGSAYRRPSGKAPVIDAGDEPPLLVRGEGWGCISTMGAERKNTGEAMKTERDACEQC